MRKIQDVKNELSDVREEIKILQKVDKADVRRAKALKKRIPVLNQCMMYLESEPTESFIRQEISRVENKITLRMNQFPLDHYQQTNVDPRTVNKLKRDHEKKYDVPKLREQVRTLRFLLKN